MKIVCSLAVALFALVSLAENITLGNGALYKAGGSSDNIAVGNGSLAFASNVVGTVAIGRNEMRGQHYNSDTTSINGEQIWFSQPANAFSLNPKKHDAFTNSVVYFADGKLHLNAEEVVYDRGGGGSWLLCQQFDLKYGDDSSWQNKVRGKAYLYGDGGGNVIVSLIDYTLFQAVLSETLEGGFVKESPFVTTDTEIEADGYALLYKKISEYDFTTLYTLAVTVKTNENGVAEFKLVGEANYLFDDGSSALQIHPLGGGVLEIKNMPMKVAQKLGADEISPTAIPSTLAIRNGMTDIAPCIAVADETVFAKELEPIEVPRHQFVNQFCVVVETNYWDKPYAYNHNAKYSDRLKLQLKSPLGEKTDIVVKLEDLVEYGAYYTNYFCVYNMRGNMGGTSKIATNNVDITISIAEPRDSELQATIATSGNLPYYIDGYSEAVETFVLDRVDEVNLPRLKTKVAGEIIDSKISKECLASTKYLDTRLGGATFKFENGGFAVYTNGVKAGTLTFTPSP